MTFSHAEVYGREQYVAARGEAVFMHARNSLHVVHMRYRQNLMIDLWKEVDPLLSL